MIVFESSKKSHEELDLKECTSAIAKFLYPLGTILEIGATDFFFCMVLRENSSLIRLEVHSQPIRDRDVERLLRSAAALEAKRKDLQFARLNRMTICLVAPRYEDSFLSRAKMSVPWLKLYEYSVMRSHEREALLIRDASEVSPKDSHRPIHNREGVVSQIAHHIPKQELSTQEVIALAHLGQELRGHRARLFSSR